MNVFTDLRAFFILNQERLAVPSASREVRSTFLTQKSAAFMTQKSATFLTQKSAAFLSTMIEMTTNTARRYG
jgi:hypothetical protein